jgi:hypothetical protein
MPNVFIVGGNSQMEVMFIRRGWGVTKDFMSADYFQFTGGADVTPEIYGEENTDSGNSLRRDLEEAGYYALGVRMGKGLLGICRGGQFLNVMNGGKMIQDIGGHAIHGKHALMDVMTKEVHQVTSTHHQMMLEHVFDSELVAVAHETRGDEKRAYDTEVVYYPKTKSLCFQPHPEFDIGGSTDDYYFSLITRFFGD